MCFFFSTFSPGNGGPLQRPSKNYEANNAEASASAASEVALMRKKGELSF